MNERVVSRRSSTRGLQSSSMYFGAGVVTLGSPDEKARAERSSCRLSGRFAYAIQLSVHRILSAERASKRDSI